MSRAPRSGAGALLLAAALAAAGCSSSGERERTVSALTGTVLGAFTGGGGEAAPAEVPGRAEFDAIALPVIAIRRGDGPRAFVQAEAVNRGAWVTYRDTARRGLTLRGGAISATDNFGIDLVGIAVGTDDPLVTPVPPDAWPSDLTRAYRFVRRTLPDQSFTFRCTLAQLGLAEVEIVERRYQTVEIAETCTNGTIRFENRHWVDPATGFVWKSTQWIGPRLSPVTFEVVNPHRT